jgi:hypothetical protein
MIIDFSLEHNGIGTRHAVSNNTVWNRTQWNSSKHKYCPMRYRPHQKWLSEAIQCSPASRKLVTKNPLSEYARKLYRPSNRRLSAKSVSNSANRGCHVVRVTDPYARIFGFLDQSRYVFFQVAPQLYSRGWVDPVPNPLLFRKSGSAGNRNGPSGSVARNSDH